MAFQFDPTGARPVDDTPKNFSFDPAGAVLEKDSGGLASDLAKSVKVGVQRLPGMAAGLADLPIAAVTGARPVTAAADAIGEATGFQPGKWADETTFSAGHEASRQDVDVAWQPVSDAKGLGEMAQKFTENLPQIAAAYARNPVYTANQVAESLPSMAAGGAIGRFIAGIGRIAAPAVKAGGVGPGAPGLVARAFGDKWAAPVAAGLGEGAVTAGQQMAQYTGDDQQKNAVASLGAGLVTGAINVGAGRFANKLGLETAETAIINAGKGAVGQAAEKAPLAAGRRIGGGMISEAMLQELPQSAQEQMWQNYAEGKDIWDGVARQAVEGAIAGGVMGAGANVSDGGKRKAWDKQQQDARRMAEDAAASANSLAEEAQNQPAPLMLGNSAPDQLISFPDGSVGRRGEVESYLANLPEEQRAEARARLMGQNFTEVNDPQAQQARRWWENYGDGQGQAPRPDYLAEVQQAVRSGTPFSTQQTVDTVRSAMEDAWLQQHVQAEAAPETAVAPAQAADAIGQQLQAQFDQAGQDAAVAAVDARVRTSRVLTGLQNVLDAGADNSLQVLARLNDSLVRIGEDPLQSGEVARVRRISDAYMGFRGVGEAAPLPGTAQGQVDAFADNSSLESQIPERPSQRMGIDPAAGPLSKVAAQAVDSGTSATLAQQQEISNAQSSQAPAAGMAAAAPNPATRSGPLEAAGAAAVSQPVGANLVPQTHQTQQAQAQQPQGGAAQAVQPVASEGLSHGSTTPENPGAQASTAQSTQGKAPDAAQFVAAQEPARPKNWRTSMLRAAPVARGMGIDVKGKRLAQVVAEIDAADAAAGATQFEAASVSQPTDLGTYSTDVQSDKAQTAIESVADRAAAHEANGPYPPSAATRIGDGQWQPAVKTGPSNGRAIEGAPIFPDASSAAAWAGYEQAKGRDGANVAALQQLQEALGKPLPSASVSAPEIAASTAEKTSAGGTFHPALQKAERAVSAPAPAGREVGNMRHAMASANNQAAPTRQTDTPAFKKWFADSKITDEAGRPRVVYHGTTADFSAFDIERSGEASDEGFYGKGLYFSSNPEVSSQYADSGRGRAKTKEGGNIMPVYLSMQKPFVTREQVLDDDQVAKLKADGHDGIVSYADPKHVEYVIFAPTQVKSAIANKGTFDGTNPDIRFSRGEGGDVSALSKEVDARQVKAIQDTVAIITKGWKNTPDVIVVANMQDDRIPAEVRDADRAQRSNGATGEPEGFYYRGKVYLVAGQLSSAKDVTRVLFHESLGHFGLRGLYGNKLDAVLNNVMLSKRAEIIAKGREYGLLGEGVDAVAATDAEVWASMSRNDRLQAAEEVLAVMAQDNPQLPLVQRAIAAIRTWLRENVPGFNNLALTNAEIVRSYLVPARNFVTGGAKSQSENFSAAFARHPGFNEAVDAAIKAGTVNSPVSRAHIEIGGLTPALSAAGVPDGDLKTSAKIIQKVFFDHGVPASVIKRLPDLLEKPVMVFKSSTVDGSYVAVTSEMVRGAPLVVAISPESVTGGGTLNFVPSLYPRDDLQAIQRWLNKTSVGDNLLTYIDKKQSPSWFGSTRLQLPGEFQTAKGLQARNIATQESGVKPSAGTDDGGVRFSRTARAVNANYTPAQQQAAEHVFGSVMKLTLAERAEEMRANFGTKLRQGLVDQFAPIKEVSDKAYILARLSKGSDGAVEAALLYGKPFLKDGVADVDIKDGGFAKVLASLKGEHDRFFQWVAAMRSERLKAEGKENLLTDQHIGALKSLNAGKFADGTPRMPAYAAALRELNAFNEAGLKIAKESGLIDQAAYDLMKDQPYVPFYRLMEDGDIKGARFSSGLINQQAFKKLKGGTQQINADLLQNTLLNWSHLYAAAARNRAALATMVDAEKMGIAYQVPADTKGAVKVMRDGVTEHWMVEDPYLLDAISALHYSPSKLAQGLAPFKRLLTMGVTINPTFKIRNLIRDSLSAMAQSDLGYNPFANVAQGWKAMDKNSQTQASMLASGGIIKFGTQEDTGALRRKIDKLGGTMLDKDGFGKLKSQMASLWEAYEEFGDRTENANRAALYERLIAKGHSHAEASFMARDLMDFSMSGKWEMVRFLTQTVPFLNARMQGLYKLGRAAAEDPKRFGAIAGAVSLASLGLLAAYGDDEDWKKREDWDRDAYWWFKIGGTAYRIPKPFEVGAIGTLAERTAELMFSKEMTGDRFGKRISEMIFSTFAMDPIPQALKPLLDVYANKDSFSGKAIEGFADERLRPQDRYSERTSEVARLLGSWGLPDPVKLAKGEYSELSPKQIDFLMRGYTGWLSTVFTTATDTALRPLMGRGERPAMQMRDVFLAGNFVESLPTNSSRYVTTMYDQARDISQVWASYQAAVKSGDHELAAKIRTDEAPKLQKRMSVESAKQQIAELSQQAKKVEGDRLMSAEAKRRRLDEIAEQKNRIAERLAPTN